MEGGLPGRRTGVLLAAALLVCAMGVCARPAAQPEIALTDHEAALFALLNEARAARGLRALALDPALTEAARGHAADMARRCYLSHFAAPPAPRTPVDRYARALGRLPMTVVGENIARARQATMEAIHRDLIESQGHRGNLLAPGYVAVGLGVEVREDGVWVTQMFRGELPERR